MNVPPDQVERALARLWDEQSQRGVVSHQRTVNVIAVVTDPDALPRVQGVLSTLMPVHPGRALLVVLYPGAHPELATSVSLVPDTRRRAEPCGELVVIDSRGPSSAWVPSAVERLLAPGVRVCLFWPGDLPNGEALYDRLAETADVVVVNSAEMDVGDLLTLNRLLEWAQGGVSLADLNWVQMRPWQELMARFFDDPAAVPALRELKKLVVTYNGAGAHAGDPASPQAALYAAWLLSRLGGRGNDARWSAATGSRTREVVVARAGGGGELTVVFEPEDRDDVPPGALLRTVLVADDNARFEVQRQEDSCVLGWEGHYRDVVFCPAVVRVGRADEAALLARTLDMPVRDTLFESSLSLAAQLIGKVVTRERHSAPGR